VQFSNVKWSLFGSFSPTLKAPGRGLGVGVLKFTIYVHRVLIDASCKPYLKRFGMVLSLELSPVFHVDIKKLKMFNCSDCCCSPVRIRVRIDPSHPLVCRKRRLNGAVLRMRPEKPRSRVTEGLAR
jgi:hypothetical protein